MRYLSVCSGIEAASAAWHSLEWEPVAFSEVDAFPSAVLKHHYPSVPNWGDMTKFQEWPDADVDVLVGGTPCQSFSVAGLRKGLDDPRGSLMLVYLAIARRYRPRWVVWENVPGVLSADGGRAFGSLLGGLAELGYGFAYRVLDAQYFGVAQRRKRVFVVGCLGDWRRAAAVLFERESLSGHPAPRRTTGQGVTAILEAGARTGRSTDDVRAGIGISAPGDPMFTLQAGKQHGVHIAPTLPARRTAGGGFGTDFDCDGGLIARQWPADVAPTLNAAFGDKQGLEDQHALGGGGLFVPSPVFATDGQANAAFAENIALTLNATHEQPYIAAPVAGALTAKGPCAMGAPEVDAGHYVAHALRADGFDASEDGTGRGTPLVPVTHALDSYSAGRATEDGTGRGCPLVPTYVADVGMTLTSGGCGERGRMDPVNTDLVAHAFDARQSDVIQYGDKTGPLDTNGSSIGVMTLAIRGRADGAQLEVRDDGTANAILTPSGGRGGIGVGAVAFTTEQTPKWNAYQALTLTKGSPTGGGHPQAVATHMAVRRLTPRECERLQGFPDDYTAVSYRGKPAADGPRYKALGNSMAVPVMHWIGKRIQMVEEL